MSSPRQVYFEFHRIGAYVKVNAIDAATAIEVAIVGDASASEMHLKRLALKKLEYVLAKNQAAK